MTLQSKYRGCMLSALIGDCLGKPYEFYQTVDKDDLNSYMERVLTSRHQLLYHTDDTAMTLCVAHSLLECKGSEISTSDLVQRFLEKYSEHPRRGYGDGARKLFRMWKETNCVDPLNTTRQLFNGEGSYGNGTAMRVHPVSLFAYSMSDDDFIHLVRQTAIVTHSHPLGINGGILQAFAVRNALLQSTPIDVGQFVDKLILQMETIEESTVDVQPRRSSSGRLGSWFFWWSQRDQRNSGEKTDSKTPFTDKLRKMKDVFEEGKDLTPEEIVAKFGNSVTAIESVTTAIYCALRAQTPINDYRTDNILMRTVYLCNSIGGDTDTIGTMACAITGALHGEECVLPVIRSQCESNEVVTSLADKLFAFVK